MILDDDQMWETLRSLDDPERLYFPANFDFTRTRTRFDRLVDELEQTFSCTCDADRAVQDATLHARVVVPAASTATGERLVVSVSNFGDLAIVSIDNPGAWSQAEFEAKLAQQDKARIFGVLDELSYIVIPEEPLWERYDGRTLLPGLHTRYGATWWTRYFDYL